MVDANLANSANLADHVRASARSRGDAPALVATSAGPPTTRTTRTWAELDADVDAAATGLLGGLGLHRGDRVALALSNTPAFVTAYFGALRAGLVAVPLNTGYTSREMARLLGDSGAKAVLTEDATQHAVEEAVAGTRRALVDAAGFDSLVSGGRGRQAPEAAGGEDLAVLLFTSGTSGRPKGAMLSHRALRANLVQCQALEPAPMRPDDVVLVVLPLFHIYGLNAGLGMVAATGATAVLVDRFEPAATLEVVRTEGVTNIPGAPPMYVAWSELAEQGGPAVLGDGLGSVRLMASGASPLPPAVMERIESRTGVVVHEGYGLTETAPVVSSTLASARAKPGSVGRPIPGVEVSLRDEAGQPVTDDDPGEIWVRGENLFSGYWPDRSEGPDADGWYATGDVAYADDDGDLFLVDRRKELILVSGFNVYPREVEDALVEHPDVAEAAVIAVPHPQTGEAVKAYVVARDGGALTAERLEEFCAERLARFKRPTVVELVTELPHSATGKVAKGRLRARESRARAADGPL